MTVTRGSAGGSKEASVVILYHLSVCKRDQGRKVKRYVRRKDEAVSAIDVYTIPRAGRFAAPCSNADTT